MTPKEKAQELFGKYAMYLRANLMYDEEANEDAKQCALIAVNEISEATKTKYKWGGGSPDKLVHLEEVKYDTYWEEVKKEIENL